MLRVGTCDLIVGGMVAASVVWCGLQQAHATNGACGIKGNMSISGERIYHVPGQKYYAKTKIDPRNGERWFCSEAESRAAGWRKSKQ